LTTETTLHPAHIPHELGGAPAGARKSPQRKGRNALVSPVIPAYSRPDRRYQDRPVTPEVAGSSPVAPVKSLQIGLFCRYSEQEDRRLLVIPRSSRSGRSRPEPLGAANPRTGDDRPTRRGVYLRCNGGRSVMDSRESARTSRPRAQTSPVQITRLSDAQRLVLRALWCGARAANHPSSNSTARR
jgi:hypothetical protein